MRVVSAALLLLSLNLATAWAQVEINAQTPEGQLLTQASQESDPAKKVALLEEFFGKYPDHETATFAYAQAVPAYVALQNYPKALEAGEKLLAKQPENVHMAHECLKAAEASKDPAAVIKWAGLTSQCARKAAAKPKPQDADEAEEWKQEVDYAKQVDVYTEYALYATALQTADPKQRIALAQTLRQQNPASEYLPKVVNQEFLAYQQVGDNAAAAALAEKVVQTDQSNEDMLLAVANSYTEQKKEPEKVLEYSQKVVDLLASKPAPEGVSPADWEKKKKLSTGLAHFLMGVTYAGQNKFPQADKSMRAALPLIEENEQLKAGTLFHLGVANYRMGDTAGDNAQILEAYRFTQQCAAIKGPYQAVAQKNLAGIRAKYHIK